MKLKITYWIHNSYSRVRNDKKSVKNFIIYQKKKKN